MSFDEDARGKDFRDDEPFFIRPATTIVISTFDGEHIETITLPEVRLTRDECSPAWLALEEAEQQAKEQLMATEQKTHDPNESAYRRQSRALIGQSRIERERTPDAPKWGEIPGATWGNIPEIETESR